MESGLLKMFHDGEHFESVYQMPFDEHTDLWDTERDTLHMNLSHTLDGILPASPHHEPSTDFDCDLDHKNYMNGSHYSVIQQNQIKLEYDSDDDEFENRKISITSIESEDLLKCIAPAVEIIPIDPDCEYSSPLSNDRNGDNDSSSSNSSDDDDEDSNRKPSFSSSSSSSHDDEDAEVEEEDGRGDNDKTTINLNLSNTDEICDMRIDFSELASFDKFMSPVKNSLLIKTSEKLGNDTSKDEGFLDDDKLDSDIDVKNFDLTKYITEDDCKLPPPTPGRSIKIDKYSTFNKHKTQTITRRGYKRLTREFIESDSDESIDVETISERSFSNTNLNPDLSDIASQNNKINNKNNDDNINADPTWTPTKTNANTSSSINKGRSNLNNKFRNKMRAIIPTPSNISQNRPRILTAGAQLSRNKLITFVARGNEPLASTNDHDYCSPNKRSKINSVQRKTIEISPINPYQDRKKQRVGVGIGKGKSLLLTNKSDHSKLSSDEKESHDETPSNSPSKQQTILVENQIKIENINTIEIKQEIIKENEIVQIPIKEKRKLNLQEYKKRRENSNQRQPNNNPSLDKIIVKKEKIEPNSKSCEIEEKVLEKDVKKLVTLNSNLNDKSNNTAKPVNISSVIQNKRSSEAIFDPILEATKKALRLKNSKIFEPKIKIPAANPLIPLLPLSVLTAMTDDKFKATIECDQIEKFETSVNLNYEEIVIVSIGCNTNITLPPNFDMSITNKILNSSSLLSNINDTINKVKCSGENIKISSNSLLSSITNEVLKKTSDSTESNSARAQSSPNIGVSPSNSSPGKPETTRTKLNDQCSQTEKNSSNAGGPEHGEDKIIMHLRKDRIKPKNYSTAVQTDSLSHFMPLQKLESVKRLLNENHYNRNGTASRNRNSSYSSNEDDFHKYSRQNIRRSRNRSPSPVTHRRHNSSSRYNYNDRRSYRDSNRSYSPNYRRRTRSPNIKRSRSRSRDHHHNGNKHQRPHSRCSTNSISSNSSSRSKYRRRKKSRRHSSSSSCSSYSSRSRSRGSSVIRRSRSRSIIKDRQTSPEERRIVYVGRIEKETTKEDIKSKFLTYGPIKQITFHHKDTGMKYGFVTYERAQDAFKAIDSGGRDPEISMYDISFGGRRAFCRNFYSDLDCASATISGNNGIQTTNISTTTNHLTKSITQNVNDSFEALLQKVKDKMGAKKPTTKT